MLAAIDQVEVMTAVMGDETSLYRAPVGFFLPGTPSANDAGMDAVRRRRSPDEIKAMLKQAGYGGERVVLMHPTDQTFYDAMSSVVAASLRRGRHQPGRTVDGLGHRRAAPHQQGAAGQGRLVAVPLRRAGGRVSRPDLRHQHARQRQGRLVRLADRREDGGDARRLDGQPPTTPSASGSMRKSRRRRSRRCRSFRSASTCRRPRGAATSPAC